MVVVWNLEFQWFPVPVPVPVLYRSVTHGSRDVSPVIGGQIEELVGAFIGGQLGRAVRVPIGNLIGTILNGNDIGTRA
jgi:hypothetical protein